MHPTASLANAVDRSYHVYRIDHPHIESSLYSLDTRRTHLARTTAEIVGPASDKLPVQSLFNQSSTAFSSCFMSHFLRATPLALSRKTRIVEVPDFSINLPTNQRCAACMDRLRTYFPANRFIRQRPPRTSFVLLLSYSDPEPGKNTPKLQAVLALRLPVTPMRPSAVRSTFNAV
ncbi:uncharacterized protein EKO05_0003532 [Ascochyta rabiei]|uniref:uncharacterized protein n=1 Tax=Didymella rabiei TaxID=5454 RepID=UPI0021FE4C71|nr:uncharacterized protein EKO05_0003532 [Ascochyta rabiei]UPX13003.1 hypothetical protein EKO05_0003532 [Ascochyta rabiei]